jgi:hypothetical protein
VLSTSTVKFLWFIKSYWREGLTLRESGVRRGQSPPEKVLSTECRERT